MAESKSRPRRDFGWSRLYPCRRNVFSLRWSTPTNFGIGGAPPVSGSWAFSSTWSKEGDYRIVMKPPEGDVFHIRGTFLEVETPRRLAYTFVYEEPHPDDQETLVTLTFEPTDPGTRLILDHGPFKTESRVNFIVSVGRKLSSGWSGLSSEDSAGRLRGGA
jgi:Activator of Hsp90 ATPase homolog 1-like protein